MPPGRERGLADQPGTGRPLTDETAPSSELGSCLLCGCDDAVMRTTLDLDDVVLSVARARAQSQGISLGRAVSELALAGIDAERMDRSVAAGEPPVLRGAPGHLVTGDLVAAHRDDD